MRRSRLVVAGLLLAVTGCSGAGQTPDDELTSTAPAASTEPSAEASAAAQAEAPESEPFDLTRHSTTDPRSIWVLVTKRRPLRPPTYVPDLALVEGYQVHPAVVRPLARLLRAGRRAGMDLRIMSAYRSYGRQASLYAGAVAALGARRAGLTSARAGHSEHQTGLAVDLGRSRTGECNVTACFARTGEARWLRENAHRFGFVLRYPPGSTRVTGYAHESWHFRYVGRPLAAYLRRERIATLDEVFARRS